jgi:hypothetical protein
MVPLKISVADVLKAEPSTVFGGQGLKVTAFASTTTATTATTRAMNPQHYRGGGFGLGG